MLTDLGLLNRRQMLCRAGAGAGMLALAHLFQEEDSSYPRLMVRTLIH